MGYTTEFEGEFFVTPPASPELISFVNSLWELRDIGYDDPEGAPDSYCQWILSQEGRLLHWDGSEKFYDYIEWLKFLIDNYFEPQGHKISGIVTWVGEDKTDRGEIVISQNNIEVEVL